MLYLYTKQAFEDEDGEHVNALWRPDPTIFDSIGFYTGKAIEPGYWTPVTNVNLYVAYYWYDQKTAILLPKHLVLI